MKSMLLFYCVRCKDDDDDDGDDHRNDNDDGFSITKIGMNLTIQICVNQLCYCEHIKVESYLIQIISMQFAVRLW